jgi:hypothetical protein
MTVIDDIWRAGFEVEVILVDLDEARFVPYLDEDDLDPISFPRDADGQIIIHDADDLADLSESRSKVVRYPRIA